MLPRALTSVDFDMGFILKTGLKNNPAKCMGTCLTLLLLIAGYSLHIIERLSTCMLCIVGGTDHSVSV